MPELRSLLANPNDQRRATFHGRAFALFRHHDSRPKSLQAKAKGELHDIWQAETREQADKSFDNGCDRLRLVVNVR